MQVFFHKNNKKKSILYLCENIVVNLINFARKSKKLSIIGLNYRKICLKRD